MHGPGNGHPPTIRGYAEPPPRPVPPLWRSLILIAVRLGITFGTAVILWRAAQDNPWWAWATAVTLGWLFWTVVKVFRMTRRQEMALISEWCKRGEHQRCDHPRCQCTASDHPKGGHGGPQSRSPRPGVVS